MRDVIVLKIVLVWEMSEHVVVGGGTGSGGGCSDSGGRE